MKSCSLWLMIPVISLPLLSMTGCAAGHASTSGIAAAPRGLAEQGVILSARQVILQVAGGENGVLGALGAPASEGFDMAPATEFIVRQDNGKVISVIEPVPNQFRPGQLVRIQHGVQTRLLPLV